MPALKNESIITEDMVIDGSVRTKSNLRVLGQISGDVKCEGCLLYTSSFDTLALEIEKYLTSAER